MQPTNNNMLEEKYPQTQKKLSEGAVRYLYEEFKYSRRVKS